MLHLNGRWFEHQGSRCRDNWWTHYLGGTHSDVFLSGSPVETSEVGHGHPDETKRKQKKDPFRLFFTELGLKPKRRRLTVKKRIHLRYVFFGTRLLFFHQSACFWTNGRLNVLEFSSVGYSNQVDLLGKASDSYPKVLVVWDLGMTKHQKSHKMGVCSKICQNPVINSVKRIIMIWIKGLKKLTFIIQCELVFGCFLQSAGEQLGTRCFAGPEPRAPINCCLVNLKSERCGESSCIAVKTMLIF